MIFPLDKLITVNSSSSEFSSSYKNTTEIPVGNHPGSFGFVRKNHIHEGIDLYAENLDSVFSVEDGVILGIFPFTGVIANSPWWEDTWCIFVKHSDFILNYGEVLPNPNIEVGNKVKEGDILGNIKTVLKSDKGRPMSMLHLEMYSLEAKEPIKEWSLNTLKPQQLLDPTKFLLRFVD